MKEKRSKQFRMEIVGFRKFRVRGISNEGRGAWYELGIYQALDKDDVKKWVKDKYLGLLGGLKLEIVEVKDDD